MPRILAVDDEVQIRELLRKALELNHYEVVTAPRADQALAALEKQLFDLVLLDVQMPGESGVWLLKKIRQVHSKMPVVIYSGIVTPELEKELREAGANEVINKETSIPALIEQLGKIVQAKERIFQPSEERKKKPILIVDDDPDIRSLLVKFFKKKGYVPLEAGDGEQALEIVRTQHPAVVLLDVFLPGMDGLTTLKKMKEIEPDLGVVMVTGQQDDELVKKATAAGAYGFILKPFDFLYLELVILSKILIAEKE